MDAIGIANAIKDGGLAALVGVLLWMLYTIVTGREKTRDEAMAKLVESTQRIITGLEAQAVTLEAMCRTMEMHHAESSKHFSDMNTAASLIKAKVGG